VLRPITKNWLSRRFCQREQPMTAPTPEEQRFHWSEGNKYALEAMKALLWLNGGSAAALLTLFGGSRPRLVTPDFGYSILSFATGAAFSVILFVGAYATQLHYANMGITKTGQRIHSGAYVVLLVALGGFLCGLWFAYNAITAALGGGL
jgi:hypothetical protein